MLDATILSLHCHSDAYSSQIIVPATPTMSGNHNYQHHLGGKVKLREVLRITCGVGRFDIFFRPLALNLGLGLVSSVAASYTPGAMFWLSCPSVCNRPLSARVCRPVPACQRLKIHHLESTGGKAVIVPIHVDHTQSCPINIGLCYVLFQTTGKSLPNCTLNGY